MHQGEGSWVCEKLCTKEEEAGCVRGYALREKEPKCMHHSRRKKRKSSSKGVTTQSINSLNKRLPHTSFISRYTNSYVASETFSWSIDSSHHCLATIPTFSLSGMVDVQCLPTVFIIHDIELTLEGLLSNLGRCVGA